MNDFVVEVDESLSLQNALVLTAFPTVGNVASTVVRFLVDLKGLKHVGGFYSPRYAPLGAIHEGRVGTPVEVFTGDCACGMSDEFERLVVVTSDAPVPDGLAHDLAMRILEWSRDIGPGQLVALEGLKTDATRDAEVHGVASTAAACEHLRKAGIPLLKDGLLGGVTGVLMHRGAAQGVDVYGLLVRAHTKRTDANASAELLRTANRVLIHADLDEETLEAKVGSVQDHVSQRQREVMKPRQGMDVAYL